MNKVELYVGGNEYEHIENVKSFVKDWLNYNFVFEVSVIYMEINISENVQIILKESSNYEKYKSRDIVDIYDADMYFLLGDRKNFAILYSKEDRRLIFYCSGRNFVFHDSETVKMERRISGSEIDEFEREHVSEFVEI